MMDSVEHSSPSLRERRRAGTRRALRQAALELFAEVGYGATTVSQIAARAEVGERTFFSHFPTKEDVLILADEDEFAETARALGDCPKSLSDLTAIEQTLLLRIQQTDTSTRYFDGIKLLVTASETSALVRGKQFEYIDRFAQAIALGLAVRQGKRKPNKDASMVAEVAVRLFHRSLLRWAKSSPDQLDAIIRDEFSRFRRLFCE